MGSASTKNSPLTGQLKSDATGLWQRLQRRIDPILLRHLEADYASTWAKGGCEEPHLHRTAGASFAPRPVRVMSLLLELCDSPSEALLRAALTWPEAQPLAGSERPLLEGVRLLDDLRHLHMFASEAEKTSALTAYQDALVPLLPALLLSSPAHQKLRTLLTSALARYERHHGG